MNQGKYHLLTILLIPSGVVLFGLVDSWWIKSLYVVIAGLIIYFTFRSKTNK